MFDAFEQILIILFIAVVMVSIFRKLNMPPILGYLATGIVVSPSWFSITTSEGITDLAHFGLVFLLFTIGLELSLPKLISMRKTLINLGGSQVVITTIALFGISTIYFDNIDFVTSFTVASIFALSSTAVGTKLLVERGELQAIHGQIALSILLFQDLAAVLFLIIIPALAHDTSSIAAELLITVPKGILIFIAMLIIGRYILRPLFHVAANARSSELFTLTTFLVVLSSAYLTYAFNLSKELGAFLAGVMVAETEYCHQIETDMLPFRDLLLGLFFITVGVQLDPYIIINHWEEILLLMTILMSVKCGIISSLSKFVGQASWISATQSGIILAQGGEFGLALLALDATEKIISTEMSNIITATIILSMAVTPILAKKSQSIAKFIFGTQDNEDIAVNSTNHGLHNFKNHVILCGYGRVGQSLALFLEQEGINFVGLDLDPEHLRAAATAGEPVFYGNAASEDALLSAGIEKAKMIIITFADPVKAKKMLLLIRKKRPNLPVLIRTKDDASLNILQRSGATEVVPDSLESSLMLASHMLLLLGYSAAHVRQQIREIKSYRYQMLQSYFHGEDDQISIHKDHIYQNQLVSHALILEGDAWLINKSFLDLKQHSLAITIKSFTRNGIKCFAEPCDETIFKKGDIMVIEGSYQDIYLAEEKILQG